ncbi:transglycosylase SLT domain-containing protein [Dermatobacter hominis]|uniref:transglycosylase SLT domain-containing protein n=1 Tax=Dermatobacter hominis TaxID=2884263 RepID=UPI001D12F2E3|nr:transglycosylase SLT domain-containing protein [Dermatobacter hominis]UDY37184.1 transglycosylase SLT domain-containing protein [Dermatobacter hominis]
MSPIAASGAVAASPLARIAGIRARFEPTPVADPSTTASSVGEFSSLLSSLLGTTSTEALGSTASPLLDGLDGSGSSTGERIMEAAKRYLGVPYRWGGTDPSSGLDCSGFVQQVFEDLGIELPRVSRDQARAGTAVPSLAEARPGDLIAFGEPVDHIAIYAGGGQIIHAPRTGDVVKIAPIHRTPTAIRRIVGDGTAAVGASGGAAPATTASGSSGFGATGVRGDLAAITASSPALAQYRDLFVRSGQRYGIDPAVLAAVARHESGGNASAVSPAGARGLMQFMPATARSMGIDPMDPAQAVDAAARYLSQQLQSFGSLELALAAYNAGPGAVRRYGGVPPYAETQNYVRRIMSTLSSTSGARR